MENTYIEHIKCPECGAYKLIEDHEIMRIYAHAVIIRSKCSECGYAHRQIYRRKE